jgi:leader peptidase (prepilin peptidase)/N-methyltransferase
MGPFFYGMITVMIIVALAVFGLIFGSFVNALVWRLHEQESLRNKKGAKAKRRRNELSILKGRSMCPTCNHELSPMDLVPVVSWVWLRGKCRYCKAAIPDSPVIELLTGLLFAGSYAAWPYGTHHVGLFKFICWMAVLVAFVALAVYDLRWFLLPDRIVFPLTVLVIVQVLVTTLWTHDLQTLWNSLLGGVVIFGLFWILYQVSKGAWIGGGDVKLALALGLLAGSPFRALVVIFFASLVGTFASIPQLLKGKEGFTKRIPFGPSLILATVVVVLYGSRISTWYQGLIIH